jgi:integrase
MGRPRPALSRLRVRAPKRVIVPLSVDEVAQFWASFRTSRDLAIVGLMLLDGLRSCEVLALNCDDLLLDESQMRVRGKGNKLRWLPLAQETIQLLHHYLFLERPSNCGPPLFVGLKGRARGRRMTAAGLRSLFRHHRCITGVPKANPHRFRHYLRHRHGPGRHQFAGAHATHGSCQDPNHAGLRSAHFPGRISAVCPRRGATDPAHSFDSVMRHRRAIHHPLEPLFERSAQSLTTALSAGSARAYRATLRCFLRYLTAHYPKLRRLDQLRRDPHILGWLAELRSHTPPLAKITLVIRITYLHRMLEDLAWTEQIPSLEHLLSRADVPRRDQISPRPLLPEQDQRIQMELLRRDDFASNLLLLQRHTGTRIGECADLALDCLRPLGPDQWIIHVPLGKLKTERWVPVDPYVCQIVEHLRSLRPLCASASDPFLLPRTRSRETLIRKIRATFRDAVAAAGITTRLVPHQNRHTYATEMLRAGVSLVGLMELLGHASPEMTLRYLAITQPDLQREYQLARSQPRHRVPSPQPALESLLVSAERTQDIPACGHLAARQDEPGVAVPGNQVGIVDSLCQGRRLVARGVAGGRR